MPDQTTAKPKRQRVSLDDCLWPLFIAACGGVCVDCHKPASEVGPLHHGHIWRAEKDGPATLENIQPLCKPCNSKHNQHFAMADYRPDGWRDTFMKLVAGALGLKLVVQEHGTDLAKNEEHGTDLHATNSTQNKRVIDWANVIFEFDLELRTTLNRYVPPSLPRLDEIDAAVQYLIGKGSDHPKAKLPGPLADARSAMQELAYRRGPKRFRDVGDYYLARGEWFDESGGFIKRIMFDDKPWWSLVDNFNGHEAGWRIEQADKLAAAKRDRERQRKDRWIRYLRAAQCTPWPWQTDDEREFIAKVVAEKDSPVRDVSEDELNLSFTMVRREFNAKKQQVTLYLDLLDGMIAVTKTDAYDLKFLRKLLADATTVKNLESIHEEAKILHDTLQSELGPNRPALTDLL
jgi:hypothetical protein